MWLSHEVMQWKRKETGVEKEGWQEECSMGGRKERECTWVSKMFIQVHMNYVHNYINYKVHVQKLHACYSHECNFMYINYMHTNVMYIS